MDKALKAGVVVVGALLFLFSSASNAYGQTTTDSLRAATASEPMVLMRFDSRVEWCKTRHQLGTRLHSPRQYHRLQRNGQCGAFARVTYALVPYSAMARAFTNGVAAGPVFVYPNNDPNATPESEPVFTWLSVDTN